MLCWSLPQEELAALRHDVAPSMLREPLSLEDTAAHYVRPSLQHAFIDMCRCDAAAAGGTLASMCPQQGSGALSPPQLP